MLRLIDQTTKETVRVKGAAKEANTELAKLLQEDIALVLEGKVAARGRQQRRKNPERRLAAAIRSQQNRQVNQLGYTVGYLDKVAAVRPYYRNLEVGTSVHVGRFLSGVFRNASGSAAPTGSTAATFIQTRPFRYEKPYFPGVRITQEIIGYRYFEGGQRNFIARGGTQHLANAAYIAAFGRNKIDLLARTLSGAEGTPSRVQYTTD